MAFIRLIDEQDKHILINTDQIIMVEPLNVWGNGNVWGSEVKVASFVWLSGCGADKRGVMVMHPFEEVSNLIQNTTRAPG